MSLGELNMEGAIPSVGVMRGWCVHERSPCRGGAAKCNSARIVEIGGQFDTQSLAAPQGDLQSGVTDTQEGKELRERAARVHAKHARKSGAVLTKAAPMASWTVVNRLY